MKLMLSDYLVKVCNDFYDEDKIVAAETLAHDLCIGHGRPSVRNGDGR